ncbi:unnamed protein product [Lupinus luteus]|uniref:Tripeptidyl-peptidase II n=1 Tax=Lupinus luteus TaxID=3873 RepID=A0AAV1WW76_LUPLU
MFCLLQIQWNCDMIHTYRNPTISMSTAKALLGRKPAPVMASFSSRGPNPIVPSILKPDLTTPRVNILSSYSLAASASNIVSNKHRGFPFNVFQGTPMSYPQITGVVGLLKTLHPNWSPAAITSAITTTTSTRDNTKKPIRDAFDKTLATPFAYGSGHVQPDIAMDPGLVYDITITDYLNFLCASGYDQKLIIALNSNNHFTCSNSHTTKDLNYPSIALPNLELSAIKVTRTVTNVGPPSTYIASVKLHGFKIVVVPNTLTFKKEKFQVIVQAKKGIKRGDYRFDYNSLANKTTHKCQAATI